MKTESLGSELGDSVELSTEKETMDDASVSQSNGAESVVAQDPETGINGDETTFSYERLKTKSSNPVHGIDYKQREVLTLCRIKIWSLCFQMLYNSI